MFFLFCNLISDVFLDLFNADTEIIKGRMNFFKSSL